MYLTNNLCQSCFLSSHYLIWMELFLLSYNRWWTIVFKKTRTRSASICRRHSKANSHIHAPVFFSHVKAARDRSTSEAAWEKEKKRNTKVGGIDRVSTLLHIYTVDNVDVPFPLSLSIPKQSPSFLETCLPFYRPISWMKSLPLGGQPLFRRIYILVRTLRQPLMNGPDALALHGLYIDPD